MNQSPNQQNAIAAGKVLTRSELKNTTGGVISKDIWLKMCLQGSFGGNPVREDGSVADEITIGICEALYDDMEV